MEITIGSSISLIRKYLNKGQERSVKAKKNILASFFIRFFSISISLLLVPMTIKYVNASQYGIWLTLSSIITWFSFFDIGFGHGLRNKLAESLAKGENELARIYVSTTYAILSIIIGLVLLLFITANFFIDWSTILNTTSEMTNELSMLAAIVFVFFCLRFVLQLLNTVLSANQEPAKTSLFDFLGNLLSLIVIFFLTKITSGNLIYLGITLSVAPVLVLLVSSLWLYNRSYRELAPSWKYVKFSYASNLMSLGVKFFIIQIAALILFNTNNIIVTQLFGPKEVTTFDVDFKLFSLSTMIFNIIAAPLWSAFTDAYSRNDLPWIKSTLLTMKRIWFGMSLLTVCILLTSPFIFELWLGDKAEIPFSLSIAMCSYVIVSMWQTVHVYFLNGIGKIKLQLWLVIFSGLINIPLAVFFGNKFGLAGITLTSTFLFLLMGIVFSIQTSKILNKSAKNIWNQ